MSFKQTTILLLNYLFISFSIASASESLSYSGRLVNSNGSPVSGPVNIKVDLAYSNAPTVILCNKTFNNVPLANGVFHLKLDLDCTPKTLTKVLLDVPATHAAAIRVTDLTNSKAYSFQSLHSIPYAAVAETAKKLGDLSATDGQFLKWNDTDKKWEPGSAGSGSGSVTEIATGAGLTGGPINGSGTISIVDGGVTDAKIASGISRTKLASGSADHVLINDGSGVISSVAQLPLSKGGTGAANAGDARTNLGLGSAAVANIGLGAGTVLTSAQVPECLPTQKLQMTLLPVNAWNCIADNDSADVTKLPLAGGQMGGAIDMNGNAIINLSAPVQLTDAATMGYVISQVDALDIQKQDNISSSTNLTTATLASNEVRLQELAASGSNYVGLKSPDALGSNFLFTLPGSYGTSGQVLSTSGVTGILSWVDMVTTGTSIGGDLTGTIANAQIGANAVGSTEIASGSITDVKVAVGANVDAAKIGTGVVSNTEFNALDGVSSNIQTQLNSKLSSFTEVDPSVEGFAKDPLPTCGPGEVLKSDGSSFTCVTDNSGAGAFNGTADRVVTTDGAGALESSAVTKTELGYVSGVTSGIQAQINSKQATLVSTSDLLGDQVRIYNGANYVEMKSPALGGNIVLTLPSSDGDANQVLQTDGSGNLTWVNQSTFSIADGSVTYAKLNLADGDIPQAKVNGLVTALSGKEPSIPAGTTAQYIRGDKTLSTFATDVIDSVLTGFTTGANSTILATDSVLEAFEKVQGQISAQGASVADKADQANITQTITAATVTGLTTPIADSDATNKTYVDNKISYSVGLGNLVPANARLLMKTCPVGWTENGTIGGAASSAACSGTTCKICQNGSTASEVPADSIVLMETCPSSWINLGATSGGPGAAGRFNLPFTACQSPSSISVVPQSARMLMATCPTDWKDVGGTELGAPTAATCDGVVCRICEAPGAQAVAYIAGASNSTTGFGGNSVLIGGSGGSTSGAGGSAFVLGGKSVDGSGGNVSVLAASGAVNGSGGDVVISSGAKAGTGSDGKVIINGGISGFVGLGTTTPGSKLDVKGVFRLSGDASGYVGLTAPSIAGSTTYTLPSTDGSSGQVLSTDGSGVMSWISPAGSVSSVFGRSGAVVAASGDYTATEVTNTAAGNIAATNVQTAINELDTEKEPVITAGTTAQYIRGDKTLSTFATDVIDSVLTGLTTGANSTILATDSVLGAFQKTQGQINALSAIDSNKLSKNSNDSITATVTVSGAGDILVPSTPAGLTSAVNKTYVDNLVATGTNQWTHSSGNIYRNSGNVGIGTTSPSTTLDVNGNIAGGSRWWFDRDGANMSWLSARGTDSEPNNVAWGMGSTSTGTVNYQAFRTNGVERLTIASGGNIGIGTIAPTELLSLSSSTTSTKNMLGVFQPSLASGAASSFVIGRSAALDDAGWVSYRHAGTAANRTLELGHYGYPARMTIKNNGNVGIGYTPWNDFGVYRENKSTVADIISDNTSSNTARYPAIRVLNYAGAPATGSVGNPSFALVNMRGNSSVSAPLRAGEPLGAFTFNGSSDTVGGYVEGAAIWAMASEIFSTTTAGTSLVFYTTNNGASTSSEKMVISQNGSVGIGTITPRGTLDVSGPIIGRASQSFAASTIDFSAGNLRHTTQNCGSFSLHNLKDGGTYMFAVQGTSIATCSFTAYSDAGSTALTVHLPPDHGSTTSGKHTIYNIAVMGTHAYIAWTPGY